MELTRKSKEIKIKKLISGIAAAALFMSGEVFAEEITIVERPVWMSHDLPDSQECKFRLGAMDCTRSELVTTRWSSVLLTDGRSRFVDKQKVHLLAECRGRVCSSPDGQYVGVAEFDRFMPVTVTRGHYVVVNQNNGKWGAMTYRFGTGPRANDFPDYIVLNDTPAPQAPESRSRSQVEGVVSVWCNPRADYCSVSMDSGDRQMSREELGEVLPVANVTERQGPNHFCSMETCETNDGEFLGLSPFYHLYQ